MANVLSTDKQIAVISVFDLHGHPKAPRVYAWAHDTDGPKKRHVTVLHIAPITSAVEAVRAAIVQEFRSRGTAEENQESGTP